MTVTPPKGRYAPSPTGPLHLGNLRTALVAWLHIRLAGGHFILRIEDLDQTRSRAESIGQILEDLRWLGLDWDEGPDVGGPCGPYLQSQRSAFYDDAFSQLRNARRVFPCYCSRKDVALAANAPHGRENSGIYPGNCRHLATDTAPPNARAAAWRYRVPSHRLEVLDQISGPLIQTMDVEVGDFVVRRADRLYAYQLAVAVDDALMGITDVVRGADLRDSTPRQVELLNSLGLPVPRYWHIPLIMDALGRRLSKRDGDQGVTALRQQGRAPQHIVGRLAASLNLIPDDEPLSARELLARLTSATLRERLIAAAAQASHGTGYPQ
ncbi:MAG: tRNA glutamyl-Q(34) synthetase GluQRS [Pseudomonadota bacterium]